MEDKNLFNKFKDREDLEYEYDDDEDYDDYNNGEWDEETF